jgi:hypothetical protein
MINFILLCLFLIIFVSVRSLRNYYKMSEIYKNLRFYKFYKKANLLIANENTKDEFIVISDWHFRLNDQNMCFDVWALADLHKLYWLYKFHNYFKKANKFSYSHILFL